MSRTSQAVVYLVITTGIINSFMWPVAYAKVAKSEFELKSIHHGDFRGHRIKREERDWKKFRGKRIKRVDRS